MESPPQPKRALISFKALQNIPSNNAKKSTFHNQPYSCVSRSVEVLRNAQPNEVPNLSIFVNKVAEEQKQQLEFLKVREDVLLEKNTSLASLRALHANLINEQKSWKRKTYLTMEEGATLRSEINEVRDRIILLLKRKSELANPPAKDIFPVSKTLYRAKIQDFVKNFETREANCHISKQIVEIESQIKASNTKANQILNETNSLKCDGKFSKQLTLLLQEEKNKLTMIFQRKINDLESEKQKLKNANVEAETSRKRLTAQKLRLRSRVAGNKQRIQHIEEEALVLQVEIDDLIAKRNNRLLD